MKKNKISIIVAILLVAVLAFAGLNVGAASKKANPDLKITNVKVSKASGSDVARNEKLILTVSVEMPIDTTISSVGAQIHYNDGAFMYTDQLALVKSSVKEANGKRTANYALNFTFDTLQDILGKVEKYPFEFTIQWFTVTDTDGNTFIYNDVPKENDGMRPAPKSWVHRFNAVDKKVTATPIKEEVKKEEVKKAEPKKETEKVTTTTTTTPVTTATTDKKIVTQVEQAVKNAATNGVIAPVRVTGVPVVTEATAKAMQTAAGTKAANVAIRFDTIENKTVAARITYGVDKLSKEFATGVTTTSANAKTVQGKFTKHFSNKVMVIDFSQKTAMDSKATLAVKSVLGSKDLVFYTYDMAANQFKIIENLAYTVDANGYLCFNANPYGMILVSEGALAKK